MNLNDLPANRHEPLLAEVRARYSDDGYLWKVEGDQLFWRIPGDPRYDEWTTDNLDTWYRITKIPPP